MTDLPRVTEILEPHTDFSKVPESTLEQAAYRGTKVHQSCAAYAQKLWAPIPQEYAGYFFSFQTWFDEYVEEVVYVEKELIDPIYGFVGHIDFYGRLKSLGRALLDWKTPITLYKQWKIQLSAYGRLLEVDKKKVDVVASLQLDPNGKTPKMVRYEGESAQDFNIFLGLLNAHYYFQR